MSEIAVFQLNSCEIAIGRDSSSDIVLTGVGVSRLHAKVVCDPSGPRISDCQSSFGVRVNHQTVTSAVLKNGDCITVGVTDLHVEISGSEIRFMRDEKSSDSEPELLLENRSGDTVRIGRDESNEIRAEHPLVSRFHCSARRLPSGSFSLVDHGSTNGTFVNGRPVRRAVIEEGDVVQAGPFRFILSKGNLVQADDFGKVRLEACGLSVKSHRKTLVDNVSLSIPPGEFVAILGPSGAGKTTLAQALTGQVPVAGGEVLYNGFPLEKFMAAFNSSIGFVSQNNLLRPELTVWETFCEQAVLRLPSDSLEAERTARIESVLSLLEIQPLAHRRIQGLSGGEAKRVHIGVELISSPMVLFLDEPLAGLDPGLVSRFMKLFRSLCDRGHTILLTTHTLEQIDLCHRILFINRSRLVFNGTPEQARQTLCVASLAEMYEKVRTESAAGQRTEEKPDKPRTAVQAMLYEGAPAYRPKTAGHIAQFLILTRRYYRIMIRDYRNMLLILIQAPLIAALLGIVFDAGADFLPMAFYFCVTISAVWIGGVNSIREISREWVFFDREYRVGLRASSFTAAKIAVQGGLSLIQALLFCLFLRFIFESFGSDPGIVALTCAACVSGSLLGLAVSSFSGNVNRAVSWLPIIFIPQIFLSGILIPFDQMPSAGELLSYATLSRPVFSMFKKAGLLEMRPWNMPEWKALAILDSVLIILMYIRVRWFYVFTRSRR